MASKGMKKGDSLKHQHLEKLQRVRKISLDEQKSQAILKIDREQRKLLQDLQDINTRSHSIGENNAPWNLNPAEWSQMQARHLPVDQNVLLCKNSETRERSNSLSPGLLRKEFQGRRSSSYTPSLLSMDSSGASNSPDLYHSTDGYGSRSPTMSPSNQRRMSLLRRAEKLEDDIARRHEERGGFMYGESRGERWEPVKMSKYHRAGKKPVAACATHHKP